MQIKPGKNTALFLIGIITITLGVSFVLSTLTKKNDTSIYPRNFIALKAPKNITAELLYAKNGKDFERLQIIKPIKNHIVFDLDSQSLDKTSPHSFVLGLKNSNDETDAQIISVQYNPDNQRMHLSTRNWDQFQSVEMANIEIEMQKTLKGSFTMQTDWAGILENEFTPVPNKPVKLAFLSADIQSDAQEGKNNNIVQIVYNVPGINGGEPPIHSWQPERARNYENYFFSMTEDNKWQIFILDSEGKKTNKPYNFPTNATYDYLIRSTIRPWNDPLYPTIGVSFPFRNGYPDPYPDYSKRYPDFTLPGVITFERLYTTKHKGGGLDYCFGRNPKNPVFPPEPMPSAPTLEQLRTILPPSFEISTCIVPWMDRQLIAIGTNYVAAFMSMTNELNAVAMQYMQIIGSFMDGKMKMQTEREFQDLTAQAHKDYHPSEQMCAIGTIGRSLARAEDKGTDNMTELNTHLMRTYLGNEIKESSEGYAIDMEVRIDNFRKYFCNAEDNQNTLGKICINDEKDSNGNVTKTYEKRPNADMNYETTFGNALTLSIDLKENKLADNDLQNEDLTPDDRAITELARQLYWPRALKGIDPSDLDLFEEDYQDIRSLIAKHNVAHNSYLQILKMKTANFPDKDANGEYEESNNSVAYMYGLMQELGYTGEEAEELIGKYPSYYAQMELLTKKIYQNPDFYTNLYDKPQNVKRIGVALDAIKNMQLRDKFNSSLRREMLLSQLVEQALQKHVVEVNALISKETAEN